MDTADVYAGGRSEEIVGQAIKGKRDQIVLATKVRFASGQGKNDGRAVSIQPGYPRY